MNTTIIPVTLLIIMILILARNQFEVKSIFSEVITTEISQNDFIMNFKSISNNVFTFNKAKPYRIIRGDNVMYY